MIIIKKGLNDVSIFTINFWTAVIGLIVSSIIMLFTEDATFSLMPICVGFLATHVITAASYNICFSYGLKMVDPVSTGLLMSLSTPISFTFQYAGIPGLMLGRANGIEISGAVTIFIGSVIIPCWSFLSSRLRSRDV